MDPETRIAKVREISERPTYATLARARNWGVSLGRGHHEPLIGIAAHERIYARLEGMANAPVRKDINDDLPLQSPPCALR